MLRFFPLTRSFICLFLMVCLAPSLAAAAPFSLPIAYQEIVQRGTCGFDKDREKWRSTRKVKRGKNKGKFSWFASIARQRIKRDRREGITSSKGQKLRRKANRVQKLCNNFPAPNLAVVTNLLQLPNFDTLFSAETAPVGSGVSGTPPTLVEFAELSEVDLLNSLWLSGLVQKVGQGTATTDECNDFYAGDGKSDLGGYNACLLPESLAQLGELSRSSETSLCMMKEFFPSDLSQVDGVELFSGDSKVLESGELFSVTDFSSTKKVVLQFGNIPDGLTSVPDRLIISLRSTINEAQYQATVSSCRAGSNIALQELTVDFEGKLTVRSFGTKNGADFDLEIESLLTGDESALSFASQAREFDLRYLLGKSNASRTEYSLDPAAELGASAFLRQYRVFSGDSLLRYALGRVSGSNFDDFRVLAGTGRERFVTSSSDRYSGGFEYQSGSKNGSGGYVARPDFSDSNTLAALDYSEEVFQSSPIGNISGLQDENCSEDNADFILGIDLSKASILTPIEGCLERVPSDLSACLNSSLVGAALQNYETACSSGFGSS